jgi:predicted transcriptional regulator
MPVLRVRIEYDGLKADFTGRDADEIIRAINSFLVNVIPELELARKLHLNFTLRDLADLFGDYIKITPEGPRVVLSGAKISDKQIIALQLVAAKVAYQVGKSDHESLTLQELERLTALNPKSISSRLSELVKLGYVERRTEKGSPTYRITTHGISWLSKVLRRRS